MTNRCAPAARPATAGGAAPTATPVPDAAAARAVLARIPGLGGPPARLRLLSGGLTNRNYRFVTGSGATYVARFSGAKSALLDIDREAEYRNSAVAAHVGVGPRVVAFAPDDGVLVVEWIEGRTFTEADLDVPVNLTRLAATCRRLHAGPRFVRDFDMFDVQRRYRGIVRLHGFRHPADYDSFEPAVRRIEQVLRESAPGTVPCHNDLLAANIMDDGRRLWLIDYEYAGNNDPAFELGDIWSEAGLEPDRLDHLVAAYLGAPSPLFAARARLFALMADYGWTLWACIQNAVSEVDFDFWTWGLAKYERARALFDSPEPDALISTIRDAIRTEGARQWPTPSR